MTVARGDGTVKGLGNRVRSAEDTDYMYDVVYIDAHGSETPVAQHLDDRKDAADVARQAAAERGAGRMVLPGSSKLPNCVCVIPVHSEAA
jgi:hypothetical protein